MGDTFRSFVLDEKGGNDTENALKALITGTTQKSNNGRVFGYKDIESEFLEEKAVTKIPFDDIVQAREIPEVVTQLEEFADYESNWNISEEEKERRDKILGNMMDEVNKVFQNYIEDRNLPYNELESQIPEMPENFMDSEIQEELEELKNLVKSRKENVSKVNIRPLSLVELYRLPSDNIAVAEGKHSYQFEGENRNYGGVKGERLRDLDPQLISTVDLPVNTTNNLGLFTRLPDDGYMEKATEIVRQYEDEFE